MYVNVAFPLRLSLLTYKVPDSAPPDLEGRIVRAPVMGRSIYGLAISSCEEPEVSFKREIREIQAIYRNVMSSRGISFLKWLADYYLAPIGTALRSSFFEELAGIVTQGQFHDHRELPGVAAKVDESAEIICGRATDPAASAICANICLKDYRAFLYHAGTSGEERSLLISSMTHLKHSLGNVIILVPEIAQLEHLAPPLKRLFGERLCVLHSKLGRKEAAAAVGRIITGASDIVVGTRSAILAPLRKVSFIAVAGEHDRSYKAEEGLRYSGRDIAVMRGFHEKATVLLSSICPSVESVYNAGNGKYTLLPQTTPGSRSDRPRIRIVAVSASGSEQFLAPELVREARGVTSRQGRFLFLVSRKGYSLLRCGECGFIPRCGRCGTPLVFHKVQNVLSCHYCGAVEKNPESCAQCGGTAIRTYGAGTEQVKEKVESLLKAEAMIIEKTKSAGRAFIERSPDLAPLVVGTSFAGRLAYKESAAPEEKPFSAAAFLNMDALLLQPDFRLYERAFQEVMAVSQLVSSAGTVFLQTVMPGNKILRFIKAYDFAGFYKYELLQRKAFNNPPFMKMILFTFPVLKEPELLMAEILRVSSAASADNIYVFGPAEAPYHSKKYRSCIQLLLKSGDRTALHKTAEVMSKGFGKIKNTKVIVDVDPLKI